MGAFEYRALDERGREKRGVIEGDTPRQVRQQLREQGLTPIGVEGTAQKEERTISSVGFKRGISATELAIMTRQLATLVKAALPLEEAIKTVAKETERPRLKSMLLSVRAKVMEGHTLADGLAEFPNIFPDIFQKTVAAGEASGHLDLILERLADYTENRQQMRQSIQMALFYPAILTVLALAVVLGLLVYVVPEVVQVFESIGQELPALTRGLIAVSDFMQQSGLWLFLAIVAVVVIFKRLLKQEGFRFRWHQWLHHLPLIKRLIGGVNSARFARTLSIMVASGVPLLEAMRIAAGVLGSLPMQAGVTDATHRVREGGEIAPALEQSGYFPPMAIHLIASGEASGNLEEMLERAAENQERELKSMIGMLMGLFEPLLLVTMGGVVMVIVLAILLPIFEINQLIQ
ncbi:MAG: type II secretion system inner membrane protein GspF [Gammaproteobacteria bacterium]|nr:type II secretion system inner membrane protein GspF [Gammaproteobacteria bacterium]